VTLDDAGIYKIELSNKVGTIESLGKLIVQGLCFCFCFFVLLFFKAKSLLVSVFFLILTLNLDLPSFIKKPTDTTVVLGKPLKIECEISGIPLPEITWFKDNEPLIENERISTESKTKGLFILTFKVSEKIDCGTYTVRLHNDSGDTDANFVLTIHGKFF
jgi:hypothetical protein